MIEMQKMWLDIDIREHGLLHVNKCKQRNFLANGLDLIDRRETWLTK